MENIEKMQAFEITANNLYELILKIQKGVFNPSDIDRYSLENGGVTIDGIYRHLPHVDPKKVANTLKTLADEKRVQVFNIDGFPSFYALKPVKNRKVKKLFGVLVNNFYYQVGYAIVDGVKEGVIDRIEKPNNCVTLFVKWKDTNETTPVMGDNIARLRRKSTATRPEYFV